MTGGTIAAIINTAITTGSIGIIVITTVTGSG
jgi:hypothetical protein